MNRLSSIAGFIVLVVMIWIVPTLTYAQETIRPADGAQVLRRIWTTRGSVVPGNEEIGFGTGSVGDINNDAIGDFAVRWGVDGRWRVYYGRDSAPDEQPAWISGPSTMLPPVVGDFWGSGRKAVGFPTAVWADSGHNTMLFRLLIYRTEHDSLASVPDLTIAPDSAMLVHAVLASDFDGDGIDDLVLSKLDLTGQPAIWIYRGGVDFGLSLPAIVLHDPERVNPDMSCFTIVGDFDGDHRPDILTGGTYAVGQQLKFWFSSMHSSVWEWDQPDRVITLDESSYPSIYNGIQAGDLDGDKVLDLIFTSRDGVVCLYLSGSSGKHNLDLARVWWTGRG